MKLEELVNSVANPVQSYIISSLELNGTVTAKKLIEDNQSISQATLYRALKKLEESNIIVAIEEVKVRAVVQKVFALSKEYLELSSNSMRSNKETQLALFLQFTNKLVEQFRVYAEDNSSKCETLGFSAVDIYVTDDELKDLGKKMNELIIPYLTPKRTGQNVHTLASIVTPQINKNVGDLIMEKRSRLKWLLF